MPKIMRKNFFRWNVRFPAQFFHVSPDIASIHWTSALCYKHMPFLYAMVFGISKQYSLQFFRQKNNSTFSFAIYFRTPFSQCFYCNKLQLWDTDSCRTYRLNNQRKRILPFFWAVSTNLTYSCLVSSFSSLLKISFCIFNSFIRKSCLPRNEKKPLAATSFPFTLDAL